MVDIVDTLQRGPPVTRTLFLITFIQSALVLSGFVGWHRVMFYIPWVWKFPPEIWRLLTSFTQTRPRLDFIFDLYFMWVYGTGIELNSPRFTEPGSFFVFVFFAAVTILLSAGIFFGGNFFTRPLILAFVYIFALDNRGKKAGFLLFSIPVEWLPWAILGADFLIDGPHTVIFNGCGIVAAHLYDFLTRLYPTFQGGRNYIVTPRAIRNYFGGDQRSRFTHKAYGTSVRPASQGQPQGQSWTSGFSNTWGTRGSGRRLGGD